MNKQIIFGSGLVIGGWVNYYKQFKNDECRAIAYPFVVESYEEEESQPHHTQRLEHKEHKEHRQQEGPPPRPEVVESPSEVITPLVMLIPRRAHLPHVVVVVDEAQP